MIDPEIVANVIGNFPNFLGFIALAWVLYTRGVQSDERHDRQDDFIKTLLTECLRDSQGRAADSERIS